ncbi:hypothetical protein ACCD01_31185, partial [Telluria sp. Tellsp99]
MEGPDLESLVRRLAGTPPEFTDEPRIGGTARVEQAAALRGADGGEAVGRLFRRFAVRVAAEPREDRARQFLAPLGIVDVAVRRHGRQLPRHAGQRVQQ